MTKEQKIALVKEVVPSLVINTAKKYSWFDKQKEELANNFDISIIQHFAEDTENDFYQLIKEEYYCDNLENSDDTDNAWVIYCLINKKSKEKLYFKLTGSYDYWDYLEDIQWSEEIDIVEPYEVKVTKWKNIE